MISNGDAYYDDDDDDNNKKKYITHCESKEGLWLQGEVALQYLYYIYVFFFLSSKLMNVQPGDSSRELDQYTIFHYMVDMLSVLYVLMVVC